MTMLESVQFHLPAIALGLLLLAGSAAFLVRFSVARVIALGTAVAELFIAVWIAVVVLGGNQTWVYSVGGWGAPLGIDLTIDGLSAVMILLVALVGLPVTIYAAGYFPKKDEYRLFWSLWLLLWAAMIALFASNDIFNLYVCLELLTISAVALVTISGQREALFAGMRYILAALAGSLIYLFGVGMIYASVGVLDFDLLAEQAGGDLATQVGLGLMIVGLLVKTALFPMHFWLPPAHANAAPPVSAVLSALVVKGSFYIIFKLMFVFEADKLLPILPHLLGSLGVVAIIWGSVMAFMQSRLKMLVAYSTVAQIGYLFILFPLAFLASDIEGAVVAASAGVFHALSHALAKGAMFLAAGTMILVVGDDRIQSLSGLSRVAPLPAFTFAIAGVSMVGLPPSGGFVSKWLYVTSALDGGAWWWGIAVVGGGLLAATYIFRVVGIFMKSPPGGLTTTPLSVLISVPPLILAVLSLGIGVFAQTLLNPYTPSLFPLLERVIG